MLNFVNWNLQESQDHFSAPASTHQRQRTLKLTCLSLTFMRFNVLSKKRPKIQLQIQCKYP